MSSLFDALRAVFKAPDPRPAREIEGDIREELEFHLDQKSRELEASGLSPLEARQRAEQSFGDVESIRRECRNVQLGERIMLQRIILIVMVVVLASVLALGWQSVQSQREASAQINAVREELRNVAAALRERNDKSAPTVKAATLDEVAEQVRAGKGALGQLVADQRRNVAPLDASITNPNRVSEQSPFDRLLVDKLPKFSEERTTPAAWLAKFDEHRDDWRHGLAVAEELAEKTSPQRAVEVLREIYPQLSLPQREQLFKPFVFHGGKLNAIQVLHLEATDDAPSVRARAFQYLKDYAFEDFGGDVNAYLAWYQKFGEMELQDVLRATGPAMIQRLSRFSQWSREAASFARLDLSAGKVAGFDLAQVLREADALPLIASWLGDGGPSNVDGQVTALHWLVELRFDAATQRAMILPILREPPKYVVDVVDAACSALGRPENTWAVDPLLEYVQREIERGSGRTPALISAVHALASIGDPRATPTLIGLIVADDSRASIEGIGANGLSDLTGVAFDPSHDGKWWLEWWAKNRSSMPEAIRGLAIPTIQLRR